MSAEATSPRSSAARPPKAKIPMNRSVRVCGVLTTRSGYWKVGFPVAENAVASTSALNVIDALVAEVWPSNVGGCAHPVSEPFR